MLKTLRHFNYWGDKGNKVLCQAKWLQNKQMVGPFLQKKGDVAFHRKPEHVSGVHLSQMLFVHLGGKEANRAREGQMWLNWQWEGPFSARKWSPILYFTLYPACLSACLPVPVVVLRIGGQIQVRIEEQKSLFSSTVGGFCCFASQFSIVRPSYSVPFFSQLTTVKPLALCLHFASINHLPHDVRLTDGGSLEASLRGCLNGWSTQYSLCCWGCN